MTSILTTSGPLALARRFDTSWTIGAPVLLALLWLMLCLHLSGEWSVNDQYNYGWFVPFIALYLFWLRWEDRPEPSPPRKTLLAWIFVGVPALFLLLPLRLLEIGTPEWRPLGWIHTSSVAALTLLYIWSVGGKSWLRHFAFPIAFFFVAVPWVTPIEVPIIQGLMRLVAAVAAETVTLFGIPTQLEGNLIRVTNGLVGVNEACSGVRSLQTALMIGLLFGELKRLSILRRIVLVAGVIAIAITANFCRAVFLVWIAATKGISEVPRWHDVAGYTILGLVFVGTLILAALLARRRTTVSSQSSDAQSIRNPQHGALGSRRVDGKAERPSDREIASQSAIRNSTSSCILHPSYVLFAFCWIVAVEAGAQFWYRAHESNLVATTRWNARWPEDAPNFRQLKIDEEVRRLLRFDEGQAAAWTLPTATSPATVGLSKPNTIACFVYFFRWKPGRNSALLANFHRPDVCLPATGWTQVADTGVRNYPAAGSFALPFRHFEFRHHTPDNSIQQVAHAFYCLWEDRTPNPSAAGSKLPQMATPSSTWTRSERIREALKGRRHLGQQVMEVVFVSNGQIPPANAESRFGELVRDVVLVQSESK